MAERFNFKLKKRSVKALFLLLMAPVLVAVLDTLPSLHCSIHDGPQSQETHPDTTPMSGKSTHVHTADSSRAAAAPVAVV